MTNTPKEDSAESTRPSKSTRSLDNKELGAHGERIALSFVQRRGMNVLEQNWTCKRGEVDLIAEDGPELVFIEVKTRINEEKGVPEEAVDERKQKKYYQLAQEYLSTHARYQESIIRFDVIAIMVSSETRATLRHHQGAFFCDE